MYRIFVVWASSMIKVLKLPYAGTQIRSTKYNPSSSFLSNCLSNPHNISAGVLTSLEALFYASNILALMLEWIVMLKALSRLGSSTTSCSMHQLLRPLYLGGSESRSHNR
ncbi:hypothetical protein Tco_0602076 [Tanacetum coccineum]